MARKRRKTRRRRRRNKGWGYASNPRRQRRRTRRKSRSRNPRRRRRSYRYNPKITKALTSGFDLSKIGDAGILVGGVAANAFLTNQLAGMTFMPQFLRAGVGRYVVGLVGAGAIGGAARYVPGVKKYSDLLFTGALAQVVSTAVDQFFPRVAQMTGLDNVGDYATETTIAQARSIDSGALNGTDGMGDFATVPKVMAAPANSVDNAMLQGLGMSEFTGGGGDAW